MEFKTLLPGRFLKIQMTFCCIYYSEPGRDSEQMHMASAGLRRSYNCGGTEILLPLKDVGLHSLLFAVSRNYKEF